MICNVVIVLSLVLFVNFGGVKGNCDSYTVIHRKASSAEVAEVKLNFSDGHLPKSFAIDVKVGKARKISLNLQITDNFLANEKITVLYKENDNLKKFQNVLIQSLMVDYRQQHFQMYHDKDQLASMLIWKKDQGKYVMEGTVNNNLLQLANENSDKYCFITITSTSIKSYIDPDFLLENSTLWKLPVTYGKFEDHVRVFKVIVGVEYSNVVTSWWDVKNLLWYVNAVSLAFSVFQSQRIQLQIAAIASPAPIGHSEMMDETFINRFLSEYHDLEYHAFVRISPFPVPLDVKRDIEVLYGLNCSQEQKAALTSYVYNLPYNFIELARQITYLLPDPRVDNSEKFLECLSTDPNAVNGIHKDSLSTGMITVIIFSCIFAVVATMSPNFATGV